MRPGIVRRFTTLAAITLFLAALGVALTHGVIDAPPGAYATRRGEQLLSDRRWADAARWFDRALSDAPDLHAAMMGKAIALLQGGHADAAEQTFSRIIALLNAGALDAAGRGTLAAAYANRGILRDKQGRAAEALADYRAALAADPAAVRGPGVIDRILSGNAHPSTVAQRAAYLERQLRLPEAERRLYAPDIDNRQHMYTP
jgi:tetratricopeptide (TPR) repeat protein